MKYIYTALHILVIVGFYLIGEQLQNFFHIPLPGSIIGFLLLFAALMLKVYRLEWVESGAHFILAFLPLYFIPATVGVIEYGELFSGKGMLLIPIVMVSTFLTMASAGWVSQSIAKRKEQSD